MTANFQAAQENAAAARRRLVPSFIARWTGPSSRSACVARASLVMLSWLCSACDLDTREVAPNDSVASEANGIRGGSSDASVIGPSGDGGAALAPIAVGCGPSGCVTADAGPSTAVCPGCTIAGACVPAAQTNPENLCLICDPARDAASWSNNDGATCDDGRFCTVEDVCQGGACGGGVRGCEDGVVCNGVSVCNEDAGACSADQNQCEQVQLCNVETDECVSTCDGCVVDGVCLAAGAAAANNPCLVCDPAQSATSLSVTLGAPCGSAATECSGQDTCNAQGECAANHLALGASCGALGAQCDANDTCDGNGQCVRRVAQDGTPCDDGTFCTDGDRCLGGQCLPGGARNCGAGQTCDETANQCRCSGCLIAGTCFAAGAVNPNNTCQVCNPQQNATAFVGNVGAACGAGPNVCSGQDTCNAQGQCAPNHSPGGTPCGTPASGACDAADSCDGAGACVARVASAGSPCDDGQFCTVGDSCQGGVCRSGAARDCGGGATCDEINNECDAVLAGPGEECAGPNAIGCAGGLVCETWFVDLDGDGFGAGDPIRSCGSGNPIRPLPQAGARYVLTDLDCCDSGPNADQARPGQQRFLTEPACGRFDYNCDGVETVMGLLGCSQPASVPCEQRFALQFAPLTPGTLCGSDSSAAYFQCEIIDGICSFQGGVPLSLPPFCN